MSCCCIPMRLRFFSTPHAQNDLVNTTRRRKKRDKTQALLVDLRKRSNKTKAIRRLRSMPFEFLLAAETLRGSMNRAVQSANAITKVHTRCLLSKPGNTGCSSLPSGKTGLTSATDQRFCSSRIRCSRPASRYRPST